MATSQQTGSLHRPVMVSWQRISALAACLIFLYILLPQVKSLSPSLHSLLHARSGYVIAGFLITTSTFFVAAATYQLLGKHRLYYSRTLLTQLATGFANRLLPAGLGGMGLITQYLRTEKHTTLEAVSVVGMDNIIGIVGHLFLFSLVILMTNVSFSQLHLPHLVKPAYVLGALLLLLGVNLALFKRFRSAFLHKAKNLLIDTLDYRKHPLRLSGALLNSLLLTILYVGILWCSSHALGTNLTFSKILVVFTAGSILGSATPTPGGLIGAEAGLFGGFLAYGANDSSALAATLLYRLLTYWLPIIPGLVAFSIVERRLKLFA